ncbi:hypothetical protein B7463_g10456, partial [Scytalidium lignicola]
MYRSPRLDYIEDVQRYRPGGYHPVMLGDILGKGYKVIHKLGYGGFATIWLTQASNHGKRYVALKVLVANAPHQELMFLRHLRDHNTTHPNIACLKEVFTIQGPNGLHHCLVFNAVEPSVEKIIYSKPLPAALVHLTDSNVLFELSNINSWSEAQVYQYLGVPQTAPLQLRDGSTPPAFAPSQEVQAIQYTDLDESLLSGKICIIDFGESFYINDPPTRFVGTPASFFAPEMLFGLPPSPASDVWALRCLIFELQTLKPLIPVFFGRLDEALAMIVTTLGPLPKAWQDSYFDKANLTVPQPGDKHPWFDNCYSLSRPIEPQVRSSNPQLSPQDIDSFLDLLRGALRYEPDYRLSAKQVAMHEWFTKDLGEHNAKRPSDAPSMTEA